MDFIIREVKNNPEEIVAVKEFLYDQIMIEYGIGPMPKFHFDIDGIVDYYILPDNSNFYIALDGDKIVATAAVRAYDRDYDFFKDAYSKEDTASIWRLMVDEKYRRHGLARRLVHTIEEFAKNAGYDKIYLNTHRYLESGIPFWTSAGYKITVEEDDYDETTHMVKYLTE